MSFGVSSNNGIPKVYTSISNSIEQVTCRRKVVVDGIKPSEFSGIKWVIGDVGRDYESMQLFGF